MNSFFWKKRKSLIEMRRQVGTIPKTLETKLEEGDYYEALQLYKSLQSRYLLILIL